MRLKEAIGGGLCIGGLAGPRDVYSDALLAPRPSISSILPMFTPIPEPMPLEASASTLPNGSSVVVGDKIGLVIRGEKSTIPKGDAILPAMGLAMLVEKSVY
jgi:hypothetical protein